MVSICPTFPLWSRTSHRKPAVFREPQGSSFRVELPLLRPHNNLNPLPPSVASVGRMIRRPSLAVKSMPALRIPFRGNPLLRGPDWTSQGFSLSLSNDTADRSRRSGAPPRPTLGLVPSPVASFIIGPPDSLFCCTTMRKAVKTIVK